MADLPNRPFVGPASAAPQRTRGHALESSSERYALVTVYKHIGEPYATQTYGILMQTNIRREGSNRGGPSDLL